jgi:cob(I)alamin adenosyltransferase
MKIYTKKGDSGRTSLYYGGRVKKTDPRIIALGDLDELQSYLGLLRAYLTLEKFNKELSDFIVFIEKQLYIAMAEVATDVTNQSKLKYGQSKLELEVVSKLEARIDNFSYEVGEIKDFVIPGGSRVSAIADIARTICRRAERSVVLLSSKDKLAEGCVVLPFLNRLSDFLWMLARWLDKELLRAKDLK